jgi:hypothetical protein
MSSKSENMNVEALPSGMKPGKPNEVHLPLETVSNILSFVQLEENSQESLYNLCLVSRSWYSACVVPLYQCPSLSGKKGRQSFVETVCRPKNVHKSRRPLSEYVKTLDMSSWYDDISENLIKKLLGKVAGGLEVFVAPETCFS